MPKVSPIQTSFNSGEVSPLVYGRVDQDWYKASMGLLRNYVPLIQGPITRRPGTAFSAEAKTSSKAARLIPFEFSTTQAYILEFGDQYCRFYRNNAPITLTAVNITGATQANPVVVTANAHGYSNGDRVRIVGVGGMTQLNNREFTVAGAAANTFQLSGVNGTAFDAYTSGGTVAKIYEIATPYLEADLFDIDFVQSADVLYLVHPDYAPRKLTRTAHTSWTLTAITFLDGPYLATNVTTTTITPSATTGAGITLTASAALWAATDVGRLVRIKNGATWGYAKIVGYTSTTVVTADVKSDFGAAAASATWRLGTWFAAGNYPATVTFYEDRLVFAGGDVYPQRIDGSMTGDYENMAPSNTAGVVADDNAVSFTLNSTTVNNIRWLRSDEKGLLCGTVGGEWVVRPSSQSEALSPTNVSAKQATSYGSSTVRAIRAGKAILFVQRAARKLREMAYVYQSDGFAAPNVTVRAEHVTAGGIKDLAYQQEPHSLVWVPRNDGVLLGFTYDREQQVIGWHPHTIGGVFSTGDAVVESVACIPSADGTRDELWMLVKRTINGATKRYVEYLTKFMEDTDAQADSFFIDSGATYSGSATTTVTGLNHLEGQTVHLLADGAAHPTRTVTSGKITLDRSAVKVQVGLPYTPKGRTLRPEAGAADGTAQGKLKRIHAVTFRFNRTLGLKVGRDENNLYEIPFRSSSDDMDAAIPLFTGDKAVDWEGDYDADAYVYFQQDQPFPSTIVAIMPQLVTQDRG